NLGSPSRQAAQVDTARPRACACPQGRTHDKPGNFRNFQSGMPAAVGPGMGKHRHLWVGSLLGSLAVACAGGDAASVADESTEGGPKNGLGDGESRDGVSVTPGGGAAEAPASPAPPRGESEDGIDGAGFVEP